jgi:1-phosphofructokinase
VIVTVTPNPSVDRTLRLRVVERGAVNRVEQATSEAGGKGINVSRALATMGIETVAVAPASVATRALLDDLLGCSIRLRTVPIDGDIRVNLSLVEPDGTVTKVNEPGPALDEASAERLLEDVADAVLEILAADGVSEIKGAERDERSPWLVGSGSLPPGLGDGFYARLADRMPDGVQVAVDADRGALRSVAGRPIALLKPNHAELEELIGRDLPTFGDVADAAASLVADGAERVLVSLGRDGALLADGDAVTHAEAAIDDVANTVGAGDALLAGYLAASGSDDALATAVSWSVAACRADGTRMPAITPRDRAVVVVRPVIDRGRRLAP